MVVSWKLFKTRPTTDSDKPWTTVSCSEMDKNDNETIWNKQDSD